jgi:hypothetical protein
VRHPWHRPQRRIKIRAWAKAYPDYWRHYRAAHPDYRQRESRRTAAKRRRARGVAKQITCIRREAGPAKWGNPHQAERLSSSGSALETASFCGRHVAKQSDLGGSTASKG